jgi:hypothetical protein
MRHLVEAVERVEEREARATSRGDIPLIGDDEAPSRHLTLLDHDNELGTERGLVLWSGFLYGQPMSIPSNDWPKNHTARQEFHGLSQVYKLSLEYDHYDAEDASVDAIRDLLYHGQDLYFKDVVIPDYEVVPVALQMLTDFVVYGGGQGDRFAELIDQNIDAMAKCDDPMVRDILRMSQGGETVMYKDLLRVSNEILKKFFQKAKDERAGVPAPDLMARCR